MSPESNGKSRISISFGSRITWSDEELINVAQAAESLGYEGIYIAESWGRDHITLLTMLALNTKRIKLGTGVTGTSARTPATMAQTASSIDSISNGRFVLGLGPGNPLLIEEWHGVPFTKPVKLMREFTDVVRMVWSGKHVEYDGEFFKLGGKIQSVYSGPNEQIPIYHAAIGPKLIELAGEIADGWMPTHTDFTRFDVLKKHLEIGAKRAGRTIDDIDIACGFMSCVDDDEDWARLRSKERLALYIGGLSDRYHNLMTRFGYGEEADRIQSAWVKGDEKAAAAAVTDEMVDNITITGTPEHCRKQLEASYEAGINMPIVSMNDGVPLKSVYKALEALAPASSKA